MERIYCTLNELTDDLDLSGIKAWKEEQVMDKIRSASDWIDRTIGKFIPLTETRMFDGFGGVDLWVYDLLAVATITDDQTVLNASDFLLYPLQRLWENGSYDRVTLDPDTSTIGAWSNIENIIEINGRWGLYERTVVTGASVASQDNSSTSLVADSGALLSPGAVLLIGSEQEVIESTGSPTDSTANLAEAVDNSEEEIDVNDSSQVNIGEVIRVDFEQMKIRDIAGNTLLVSRGWNGTKRVTHADTTDVYVYRTYTVSRGANGTTAAAHTSASISQYVPPHDVNYLCRQIATLMMKKAQSGYAGKTGDANLGEVFYHQEFPNDVIKRIKSNYFVPVT